MLLARRVPEPCIAVEHAGKVRSCIAIKVSGPEICTMLAASPTCIPAFGSDSCLTLPPALA